jgi:uncharacterized membrane protein (UPF0127 family)
VFLKPLLGKSDVPCRLVNQRNDHVVAETVFAAFDSASRRKGLLGRDGLAAGTALIIAPTNAIHTWFMRFDIDVAFVAKDGRVVKVSHRLRPWRLFAALRAYAAIELPPGALAASDTAPGDTLALEPATKPGPAEA